MMQAGRWELSDGLVIRLDTDRERITELEGTSAETFQTKMKRGKKKKKKKDGREGGSEEVKRTGSIFKARLHLGVDCGL